MILFITFWIVAVVKLVSKGENRWIWTGMAGLYTLILVGITSFLLTELVEASETVVNGPVDHVYFHNSAELERITGVGFPEVELVDSSYTADLVFGQGYWYITEKFIPQNRGIGSFEERLKNACEHDECWNEDDGSYYFHVFTEHFCEFDRSIHGPRMYEMDDGTIVKYWQGYYLEVNVPAQMDTIEVKYGWTN